MTAHYKNIVVHLPNWLGDTMLALPFLHGLRSVFPHARITATGRLWVSDILHHFPPLDAVVSISSTSGLINFLRGEKFDLGFLLPNSFRTALAFKLGRVPERAGYALDMRGILLTHPLKLTDAIMRESMVEYYMRLLEPFADISEIPRIMKLYPDEAERAEARRVFLENGWDGSSKLVGVNPFAFQWDTKRWLPERFAEVADRLAERYGVRCVFSSVEKDRPLMEKIKGMCRRPIIDLVGKVPLKILPAFMEHLSLFITNDSGLMHVAAAADIPIVAVFGSTDWQRTAPWSQKATLIRRQQDHEPCMKPTCSRDFRCMNDISVDEVFNAAEKYL
ncbi:MAG TPA: lipopolysaccharide heptosyltransferase II [Candidatus Sumerlaeota bacterium]|nr:lipopolysaccharide heptosyltransferase II [Candidatus Sumerlaeota bacterium]HON49602.1 lipopolysaccharide heptosyltransferase II [Candidatus Sumerlaeota bacterium]HOR64754.1 lipopolysaccharide heptosyltransferase II [Candidatus Sumerlaeota bacterium]HPL74235.1 lipopolysaccharide heptosyltransferase II [Candidatus Sumerlaeota bacterium]